jgi:hypothetical protein
MFLDTSGLLCLLHKDEPHHEQAKEVYFGTQWAGGIVASKRQSAC